MTAIPRRYEKRLCSHHDDHRPSLSVDLETGRGKCFACGWSGAVEPGSRRLRLTPRVGVSQPFDDGWIERETTPTHANLGTDIMLTLRCIDTDIAGELGMRAQRRAGADWLVFVYRDEHCRPLYVKMRNADGSKESMQRYPRGAASALYNLPDLAGLYDHETPTIVEGELDVAALWQLNYRGVVSVPDGAGSRLTPGLLAPMRRFKRVRIGTDSDEAGEKLAQALAVALRPVKCLRWHWEGVSL